MKKSILVVDDMELNRAILCEIFRQDYHMIEAENGEEALECIKGKENELAAVLLDIVMPVMDGFAALEKMNQTDFTKKVPVFLITAENTEESTIKGYEMGVMDVIGKPFVSHIVKRRIESVIELFHIRDKLSKKVDIQERELDEKRKELESLNRAIVETLATAIEFRDCESGDHVRRIHDFTLFFLNKMEFSKDMNEVQKEEIATAAILHDVGKIAIPDNILNKPGKLTSEEFEIMKSHTVQGCELLERIPEITHHPIYKYAYDICRHHHERWDGRGYPDGLAGEEISMWSQIVALADVYDALTTDRVYKKAFTHEESLRMILNGECGQFNPMLMETLRDLSEEIKAMLLNRIKK